MRQTYGERDTRLGAGFPVVSEGDRVFLSLLPDRPGELRSEAHRVFQQALGLLREAGVVPGDAVRTRVFYVAEGEDGASGIAENALREIHGVVFDHPGPAFTPVRVPCLPGGAFVQIEIEAVRGAAPKIRHHAPDEASSTSLGVRWGDEIWLSGIRALEADGAVKYPGSAFSQAGEIARRTEAALQALGADVSDGVSSRHWMRHDTQGDRRGPEWQEFMRRAIPTSAGIAVSGVGPREAVFMFEVDAVAGTHQDRRNLRTGRTYEIVHNYCRSVRVGRRNVVYVAGTTSIVPGEIVRHPGDVAGQISDTLETIRWGIERQGLGWSDLKRTRTYIVGGPDSLRVAADALRDVLGDMPMTGSLTGVPVLGRPVVVVEIEATAVSRES